MPMFDAEQIARATALVARCTAAGIRIATAESCTGGLIGALLTEVPGSSAVFGYGFITYANTAKRDVLGVPEDTLARYGAVSPETAEAMARGALARSAATVAVAVTGVAGPGGGTDIKPVGLVHFGLALRAGECRLVERRFGDLGRSEVRRQSLLQALTLLEDGVARQDGSPP